MCLIYIIFSFINVRLIKRIIHKIKFPFLSRFLFVIIDKMCARLIFLVCIICRLKNICTVANILPRLMVLQKSYPINGGCVIIC